MYLYMLREKSVFIYLHWSLELHFFLKAATCFHFPHELSNMVEADTGSKLGTLKFMFLQVLSKFLCLLAPLPKANTRVYPIHKSF